MYAAELQRQIRSQHIGGCFAEALWGVSFERICAVSSNSVIDIQMSCSVASFMTLRGWVGAHMPEMPKEVQK